jgi:hypothetical protein
MSRKIVTTCNELYAEVAATLVASVHRTSFELVDEIVLYDLGLTGRTRARFMRMEKVTVRDFPPAAYRVFREFMEGGKHGYKLWIFDEARLFAEPGDAVLWMDAGCALMRSAEPIFDTIERLGVFAVRQDLDEGDRTQQRWTTGRALELMEAADDDRISRQVCGGVFGWVSGGRYQSLVDQCFAWSLDPEILLGPADRHRWDQSILTAGCTRWDVPSQSEAIYCEWRGPDVHPEQVVYAHRGAFIEREGLREREPPPVVVLTSDVSMPLLPAFAHLFAKYWDPEQRVVVGGFTEPAFELPANFTFHRIGAFEDYPVERWSDALVAFLETLTDELVVWCMDDYWLTRPVDVVAVERLTEYMRSHPDVARCDLTVDVMHVGHARELERVDGLDLVECDADAPFRLGLQCGIWRRELLLRSLVPGETPWQVEFEGTKRMVDRVVGTRQGPVRYLVAMQQGRIRLDGGDQDPPCLLTRSDVAELEALGYLPASSAAGATRA